WKLSLSVPPGEAAGWKSLVLIRADGSEIVISQAFRYNEPGRIEDWAMGQAGLSDSAALRSDGTIVYWGSVPWLTSVPSGNGFTKISLSTSHGSALKSSGEIVEWGNNWPTTDLHLNWVDVAVGRHHTVAVDRFGSVFTWDREKNDVLNGPAIHNAIQVRAAGDSAFALLETGKIVGWGANDGDILNIPNASGRRFVDFSVYVSGSIGFGLGLTDQGSVIGWGSNDAGQLNVPAPNEDFIEVAAGHQVSVGWKEDGSLVCWGAPGPTYDLYSPSLDPGERFVAVSMSAFAVRAVTNRGKRLTWTSGSHAIPGPVPNTGFSVVPAVSPAESSVYP